MFSIVLLKVLASTLVQYGSYCTTAVLAVYGSQYCTRCTKRFSTALHTVLNVLNGFCTALRILYWRFSTGFNTVLKILLHYPPLQGSILGLTVFFHLRVVGSKTTCSSQSEAWSASHSQCCARARGFPPLQSMVERERGRGREMLSYVLNCTLRKSGTYTAGVW